MKEKAVIYLRVSTEKQTEESQLEPCKKLCEEKGWEIIGVFPDHGTSAYHNVIRPQYNEVIKLVKNRKINYVVVWALDRWSRQGAKELQDTVTYLSAYNVQLHSVQEQWIESINVPGMGPLFRDFFFGLIGWLARMESVKISERVLTSSTFQKAIKEGRVGLSTISQDTEKKVIELLKQGKTYKQIKEMVHISEPTISRIKKSNLN
jgi:DNA invertase Pin-like site-specific DNA recombinase